MRRVWTAHGGVPLSQVVLPSRAECPHKDVGFRRFVDVSNADKHDTWIAVQTREASGYWEAFSVVDRLCSTIWPRALPMAWHIGDRKNNGVVVWRCSS